MGFVSARTIYNRINTKKCRFCKGSLVIDETLPVSLFCDDDAKNVIHNRAYIFKWSPLLQLILTTSFWNTLFYWIGFNELQNNSILWWCDFATHLVHVVCFAVSLILWLVTITTIFWTITLHMKSWYFLRSVQKVV